MTGRVLPEVGGGGAAFVQGDVGVFEVAAGQRDSTWVAEDRNQQGLGVVLFRKVQHNQ